MRDEWWRAAGSEETSTENGRRVLCDAMFALCGYDFPACDGCDERAAGRAKNIAGSLLRQSRIIRFQVWTRKNQ